MVFLRKGYPGPVKVSFLQCPHPGALKVLATILSIPCLSQLGGREILSRHTIFWLIDPTTYINPVYHLVTGGLMLGAIYMATDMVSSPMTAKSQIIYGVGIGFITIFIRMFGAYPEGISFAILIMNAFTPLLNYYIKPKRFGGKK